MNLSTVTSRSLYYSSVQGEKNKGSKLLLHPFKPTPKSPKRRESESNRASTPQSATKTIRKTARSILPKKFFSPCLPSPKHRRLGCDYQDDDATPVIFYADEEAVVRRVETPFVDPFAFEKPALSKPKKIKSKVASPTSVFEMGLFTVEEESISDSSEEETVFFDDPFFPRSLTRVFDENTSIDLSEGVKSINASYGGDDGTAVEDCSEPEEWFGFFNKESFASYEWDPELEDKSFE